MAGWHIPFDIPDTGPGSVHMLASPDPFDSSHTTGQCTALPSLLGLFRRVLGRHGENVVAPSLAGGTGLGMGVDFEFAGNSVDGGKGKSFSCRGMTRSSFVWDDGSSSMSATFARLRQQATYTNSPLMRMRPGSNLLFWCAAYCRCGHQARVEVPYFPSQQKEKV